MSNWFIIDRKIVKYKERNINHEMKILLSAKLVPAQILYTR